VEVAGGAAAFELRQAAAANMSIACAHVRIGPNALGGSLLPWN